MSGEDDARSVNVQMNIKMCLTVFDSTANAPVLFADSSQFINNGPELID
jgi:hypothetical protein